MQYFVHAESASDVQKSIHFIKRHRVRPVIRNTGNDYLDKSTGAGAVAIWVHYMKGIQSFNYQSSSYTGKATKVGAGMQLLESNVVAYEQRLTVFWGNCISVRLAEDKTKAIAMVSLSHTTVWRLATDKVLEWKVVAVTGRLVRAVWHNYYKGLWWPLPGDGGTYGVVVLIVRNMK